MPGESRCCQSITLTRSRNLVNRRGPLQWLFLSPHPTLLLSSPRSTSSPVTEGFSKCSPPPGIPSAKSAGNSATSLTPVPAHSPSAPSALSPIQKQSIAALTLPALRVVTSNRSSPAAHPQWRAVLTAKKSSLRAAGIAPPTPRPPLTHPRCHLDRHRTA